MFLELDQVVVNLIPLTRILMVFCLFAVQLFPSQFLSALFENSIEICRLDVIRVFFSFYTQQIMFLPFNIIINIIINAPKNV